MIKPKENTIWLAIILIIAAFLRFWKIWDQEFSYDELSAILRAENAKTWHEHITSGVLPDGHPAGLQTFIWLWVKLFGSTVIWLKSLMAICGVATVYFIYRTGKILLNEQAGLLAALFMAIFYMPVAWSLQVRPYSPGLLVVSGALWMAGELLFNGSQKRKHYLFFMLFLSLSFYIHYFAALTSITILICAIFFCHKNQRLSVFLCGLIAFILFIPHISITLSQFGNKGLTWLSKPDMFFFAEHIHQIFSQSWLYFDLNVIIVFTGFLVAIRNSFFKKPLQRRTAFLFLIFIVPLLTGYFYSILRAPVLQHNVLIFSMPALLLLYGVFYGFLPTNLNRWCLLIIGTAGISVLVIGKGFYSEANLNAYQQEIKSCNYFANKYGKKNVSVWMQGESDILEYHIQKNLEDGIFYNRIVFKKANFCDIVPFGFYNKDDSTQQFIAIGLQSGCNPEILAILEDNYGDPLVQKYFAFGEFRLYKTNPYPYHHQPRLKTPVSKYKPLSTKQTTYLSFSDLKVDKNDFIVIMLSSIIPEGEIQTAILNGDKQIDWRSTQIKQKNWNRIFHIIKLSDILGWNNKSKLMIKLHIAPIKEISPWYDHIGPRLGYRIMKGNPYMYGINNLY